MREGFEHLIRDTVGASGTLVAGVRKDGVEHHAPICGIKQFKERYVRWKRMRGGASGAQAERPRTGGAKYHPRGRRWWGRHRRACFMVLCSEVPKELCGFVDNNGGRGGVQGVGR